MKRYKVRLRREFILCLLKVELNGNEKTKNMILKSITSKNNVTIGGNGKNAVGGPSNLKNAVTAAAAILLLSLIAFKKAPDTNRAEVNSIQGILIFTDSRPVATYTTLGTISGAGFFNDQYTDVRDNLVKKARKRFPEANGIILSLTSGGTDKADVIKIVQ